MSLLSILVLFLALSSTIPVLHGGNLVKSFESKLTSALSGLISLKSTLDAEGIDFRDSFPSIIELFLASIDEDSSIREQVVRNVSEDCGIHTRAWIQALLLNVTLESNAWALQMIDAWPKFPEGILKGHAAVLGNFDECLGIRANLEEDSFKGKYCSINITPDLANLNSTIPFRAISRAILSLDDLLPLFRIGGTTMSSTIGTCYPSSCSKEDVAQLITNTFNIIPGVGKVTHPTVTYCTTDDPPRLIACDITMLTILSVIGLLCLSGTALDLLAGEKSSLRLGYGPQAILSFSVTTNTRKWLNTRTSGADNFGCIHGIRFLSTCWVVLGHTWLTVGGFQNTTNSVDIAQIHHGHWSLFAVINGTMSVDTFLAMSGILFSYNMLKALHMSKGIVNIPLMYLHRYLRLTPTYALLVGFLATIFKYARDGPLWYEVISRAESCRRDWWRNLLYINNFYAKRGQLCFHESWYLSIDFQFFLIAPLFVYPLFKWERLGMVFLFLASIASIATPWIIHVQQELIPTFLFVRFVELGPFITESYVKPWMRFGPYAVGLWTGFILYKTTGRHVKVPKWAVLLGWLGSTATALAIVFGINSWFDPAAEIPNVLGGFYASGYRFGWGIVISWIIFACTKGYGGPVNTFLSWKAFVPLGRLTFCVYLIASLVQMAFQMGVRETVTYNAYTYTNYFFAHMTMSLLLGFVCCITMESPFIALEKILFKGLPKVKQAKDAHMPLTKVTEDEDEN